MKAKINEKLHLFINSNCLNDVARDKKIECQQQFGYSIIFVTGDDIHESRNAVHFRAKIKIGHELEALYIGPID